MNIRTILPYMLFFFFLSNRILILSAIFVYKDFVFLKRANDSIR